MAPGVAADPRCLEHLRPLPPQQPQQHGGRLLYGTNPQAQGGGCKPTASHHDPPQVQRDFEELPTPAAMQLRDSLLQLLVGFCQGSPPVRTQLCIALAACAAHLPSQTWGQQGVLGWLRDMLSQQQRAVALSCLLEMLVVLPQVCGARRHQCCTALDAARRLMLHDYCTNLPSQEASSYRVAIRPDRRRQLLDEVKQQLPLALQLLSACLAENSTYIT